MLGRLGFAGRLLAIIFLVLLAALAIGAGAAFVARPQSRLTPHLPLPEQAAAIVALLDATDQKDLPLVLKAVNSDALEVTIEPARPTFGEHTGRLPTVEWMMAQYIEATQGRDVIAVLDNDAGVSRMRSILGALSPISQQPLHLAISLTSGSYAVFETRSGVGMRVFGLPAGFWIGALGALVGAAAIRAVMREARPLQSLLRSVNQFAEGAEPQHVLPEGAREIQTLISAVNDMQSRIAKLVEGRTILLGAISHDLRTFLTRLRLRIEAIPDSEQHTKATRDLDDMVTLIDDALVVARGNAQLERKETVNLAEVVEMDLSDRPAKTCTYDGPLPAGSSAIVMGDQIGLRRLTANLVDNALRFGTRCRICLSASEECVSLTVEDDGPGIQAADRAMIFEPFYRADASRSRTTGGSGLGLAISKQIVDAHGASMAVGQSDLGGAKFVVTFEAHRAFPALRGKV